MRWSTPDIADAVAAGLQKQAKQDDSGQVVYGFDALPELGLHPLVAGALQEESWGVWREQRYPGHWAKKSRAEGLRCDLVLTPGGLPLRDPEVKDTLFAASDATDAEGAYWLEMKTVAQYDTSGPFRRYSAELLSPVTKDVSKIWNDPVVKHGGLLLVLFTVNEAVAEHDLHAWHTRCIDRGYPVGPPAIRGFSITDRIGNGWCSVALFGVRGV